MENTGKEEQRGLDPQYQAFKEAGGSLMEADFMAVNEFQKMLTTPPVIDGLCAEGKKGGH